MTSYTKRDLRAADLLAIILFGAGLVLAVVPASPLADRVRAKCDPAYLWAVATALVLLGTVLNLKVRQLVRTKGVEPKAYDGVPE